MGFSFFLFSSFVILKKYEESIKLKCNGVQFKCNTVNSKKRKKEVKTASS